MVAKWWREWEKKVKEIKQVKLPVIKLVMGI